MLVANPGRIKQDVIAQVTDLVDHLPGVVDRPVISTKLNDCKTERARLVSLVRRNVTQLLAQIRLIKAVLVNTANKAKRITRRFQINRRRACLDQRTVVVGLMVVAVKQHQIAARQQRIGHHFIGRRSPVQHKVGFIRVENFRGKFLRMFR